MLITHTDVATLGSEPRLILDGALLVQDGCIVAIGAADELAARYPSEERWDARGQLTLPASICAHTHFYGAFSRGMPCAPFASDMRAPSLRVSLSVAEVCATVAAAALIVVHLP